MYFLFLDVQAINQTSAEICPERWLNRRRTYLFLADTAIEFTELIYFQWIVCKTTIVWTSSWQAFDLIIQRQNFVITINIIFF